MDKTHPDLERKINQALFPNEPIIWLGRPGGRFLTTKGWIFMILVWAALGGSILNELFQVQLLGDKLKSLFFGLAVLVPISVFIVFMDRFSRRDTLYAITDRRILMGAIDEDGGWLVRTMPITRRTKVWHARKWNAINVHTPFFGNDLFAKLGNKLRFGGITLNDVHDQEDVINMIKTMVANSDAR